MQRALVTLSRKATYRSLVMLGSIMIVALMLGRLWWLPAQASLNINEGWNAAQAMRALGPGRLYPPPQALIANNYPPLSFFIVGWLGRLGGDFVVTGRIVALVAQAVTGVAVCVVVNRLCPDRRGVALAAMLLGGYSVTLLRPYLGMNDPQWLAHAAMSSALTVLVPRHGTERTPTGRIVTAAALVVCGGLIKHNLVAIPLAITCWLWVTDRRTFIVWMVAILSLCIAAAIALFAIWGDAVFVDVLAPARSYSLARMMAKGAPLLLALLPVFIVVRPLWREAREDPRLMLPILLLAVAVPIGIVQRAGSGVVVNAFFEAVIAASIAGPVALARGRTFPTTAVGIMLLPILCLVPGAAIDNVHELRGRDAAVAAAAPFIAAIARAKGPVACDDQAICYWAGRESAIDFFSVNQRLLKGEVPALASALARGDVTLVEMRSTNPGWRQNLLLPAIHARYHVLYRDHGIELLAPARRYRSTSAVSRSRTSLLSISSSRA